jgi:hypothetical protein
VMQQPVSFAKMFAHFQAVAVNRHSSMLHCLAC